MILKEYGFRIDSDKFSRLLPHDLQTGQIGDPVRITDGKFEVKRSHAEMFFFRFLWQDL